MKLIWDPAQAGQIFWVSRSERLEECLCLLGGLYCFVGFWFGLVWFFFPTPSFSFPWLHGGTSTVCPRPVSKNFIFLNLKPRSSLLLWLPANTAVGHLCWGGRKEQKCPRVGSGAAVGSVPAKEPRAILATTRHPSATRTPAPERSKVSSSPLMGHLTRRGN